MTRITEIEDQLKQEAAEKFNLVWEDVEMAEQDWSPLSWICSNERKAWDYYNEHRDERIGCAFNEWCFKNIHPTTNTIIPPFTRWIYQNRIMSHTEAFDIWNNEK